MVEHVIRPNPLLGLAPRKNSGSHIDASHSRQPLVKGERLVRYEVNAVMLFESSGSAGQRNRNAIIIRESVDCQLRREMTAVRQGTHGRLRDGLVEARKPSTPREMLLWMTPSEAPKALQASECSELLDPMRASCWISAQH